MRRSYVTEINAASGKKEEQEKLASMYGFNHDSSTGCSRCWSTRADIEKTLCPFLSSRVLKRWHSVDVYIQHQGRERLATVLTQVSWKTLKPTNVCDARFTSSISRSPRVGGKK